MLSVPRSTNAMRTGARRLRQAGWAKVKSDTGFGVAKSGIILRNLCGGKDFVISDATSRQAWGVCRPVGQERLPEPFYEVGDAAEDIVRVLFFFEDGLQDSSVLWVS